jgi:tRNA nucleotidyltransferase/poly(A) polymerase
MSDYKFMLESHLTAEQSRALAIVQRHAADAGLSLFLTGGAMRDMLGGFPIRDLDFTAEGNALKLARTIDKAKDARILSEDDNRKSAELLFASGVTASIGMSRTEKFGKPGAAPKVTPASIHEDLRGRDFTINSIALSLNKASHGLLLDPTNGQADLERRELRTVSNYTLYDDPGRVLRMFRLKARMGLTIDERTLAQYANVREAELETRIPTEVLRHELEQIGGETNCGEVLEGLEKEGLLKLFSPALTGAKLNIAGFTKLQKARQTVPFGMGFRADYYRLFLFFLLEKLSPKDKSSLVKNCSLPKSDLTAAAKLAVNAKKFEKVLKSPKLKRPSLVYATLSQGVGEEVLFVLSRSTERLVLDRVKNYFQKYLLMAQEVTDAEVSASAPGLEPGTPKFAKAKAAMISKRLDARPKKPTPEEELPPAPSAPPILSRVGRPQSPLNRQQPSSPNRAPVAKSAP